MRVAIVGTGISGLVTAYLLHRDHEITVFEANDYIGGHTHTIPVERGGQTYNIDTGFIVFNNEAYPNFVKLLKLLGVSSKASNMSFSARCDQTGLEYCGSSLNQLFAQRRNLLRPSFYRMLMDIQRFNRESMELLSPKEDEVTLGRYLQTRGFSKEFVEYFIVPMGAAIWSAEPKRIRDFPARLFVQFFHNHRFLNYRDQPEWRVIEGGSWQYVDKLVKPFRDRIRLRTPVQCIERSDESVYVKPMWEEAQRFDEVVIATHSDQALSLLEDPSEDERNILGSIAYQENEVVLHCDTSVLPRSRRAWASWNYRKPLAPQDRVAVTYNMNMLQGIDAENVFCVTLNNADGIDPAKIILKQTYHHPIYSLAAERAQAGHERINGVNRTYFCGAYWGYGFHEDGVNSALSVCRYFGVDLNVKTKANRTALEPALAFA